MRFSVLSMSCLAIALGMLAGCSPEAAITSASETPLVLAPLAEGQVRVKAASLKFMDIQVMDSAADPHVVWAPARIAFREDHVSEVTAPVSGRVIDVQGKVGDIVKIGTPLATIASPDASRIRGELSNAQIELQVAQAEAKRQQLMMEKGIGIEAESLVAQARLQEARHRQEVAMRAASYLGKGGGDALVLTSPRAGVVLNRGVVPGASVGAETGPLFTVGDPKALWVMADVFESDLGAMKEGAEVQIEIPSLDQPLIGKVTRMSSALNAQTRRGQVYISLLTSNADLRAGMLARAGIQTRRPEGLSVPVNAVLVQDGQRSIVFVQHEDTVFEARTVTLGQPSNGFIPVLAGLKSGDRVVVKGALLLDGAANQLL